jgi:hypothetical protein
VNASKTKSPFFVHFFRGKFHGKFCGNFPPKNVEENAIFREKKVLKSSFPFKIPKNIVRKGIFRGKKCTKN